LSSLFKLPGEVKVGCFIVQVDGIIFSLANFRISSVNVDATESGTWKDLVQRLDKSKTGFFFNCVIDFVKEHLI